MVGGVHAAHRRLAGRRRYRHARQVGVAVVGEQQLDRRVGECRHEGPFDDADHLGLAFGHLQRIGEAGLELLPADLHAPAFGFALGMHQRGGELLFEPVHERVRLGILTHAGARHHEDDRRDHHGHRAARDEEAVEAGAELRADERGGDRESRHERAPEQREQHEQALHAPARGAVFAVRRCDRLATVHFLPPSTHGRRGPSPFGASRRCRPFAASPVGAARSVAARRPRSVAEDWRRRLSGWVRQRGRVPAASAPKPSVSSSAR
jgi:hypothetical protein